MEAGDLSYEDLSQVLRTVARAVEEKEREGPPRSFEQRRLFVTRRLLEGERVDADLLNYNLANFHVGIVVAGREAASPFSGLRKQLNSRLLVVPVDERMTWAWLGGGQQVVDEEVESVLSLDWPEEVPVACGEPAEGLDGWRLTHRQALAALPVATHQSSRIVRYSDVALLTAALHDDRLSSSLRQAYLQPLEQARDGGLTAKNTLRAYFKARRNVSSAAAHLGVNRATVRNRLTAIEDRLGQSPDAISAELELALRLDEITGSNMVNPEP